MNERDRETLRDFAGKLGIITGLSGNRAVMEYFKAKGKFEELKILKATAFDLGSAMMNKEES